jgi:hypothetical protein
MSLPSTGRDHHPSTMIGVVLTGHGGFEKLQYRKDHKIPSPGPDEVLIRVAAAGISNTDINTRIGWYSKGVETGAKKLRMPVRQGQTMMRPGLANHWSSQEFKVPTVVVASSLLVIMSAPSASVKELSFAICFALMSTTALTSVGHLDPSAMALLLNTPKHLLARRTRSIAT